MAKAVVICLLLLSLLLALLACGKLRPGFRLVDAAELQHVAGFDAYFESFSAHDRAARGGCVGCREAYLAAVVAKPPPAIVDMLARDVAAATAILSRHAPALIPPRPMRVAVLRDSAENGWPHTHGAVVCLPLGHFRHADGRRVETLIHELVHVHQRADPAGVSRHLASRGYVRTDEQPPPEVAARSRKNPDLAHVWRRLDDDTTAVTLYLDEGSGSADMARTRVAAFDRDWQEVVTEGGRSEHPYEEMAYEIAAALRPQP
jgi:hypothetical protein